ncbi:Pentatricopeptide repeat-containing protein [Actinidia chinensis var. chinensis]|uniref:Pentatricopeptide repeat-containing protein n=1 Tax=Actinidia chinensis var. chinensis TaxID=1590841 RepID=A0A2R6QM08_ACTCC|nr:Pentatricopeptide repeat-containing protein [Actinidia chinensis var. chinensis]
MAFCFCSSPSSPSHHQHRFCNSLSPPGLLNKPTPFRPAPYLKHSTFPLSLNSRTSLQIARISVQDPISEGTKTSNSSQVSNFQCPDEKTNSSSKSYIWVNPKSSRAPELRRHSYDARYASLVRISKCLNSCNPTENDVFGILVGLGNKVVEQDAVVVLNNMSNSETAPIVLKYFQQKLELTKEVILYNVTLKVMRKCKDLDRAEKLFDEMLKRGIKPDNVTFSTIISCARLSSLPKKAVEWYENMSTYDCEPDGINHAVMIDVYGRVGNIDMALSLYDRARAEKWAIDAMTFSTLIKVYGISGNFDGCLNVYEEMKALGIKPTLAVYNTLLDAMGRAKRPWQAKTIYKEIINNGFTPTWATYAALIRAFGKARYGEDGLNVYIEMKKKGMELNVTLYNTLLAMCADVGHIDEAVEIFEDMKKSETCKPDRWTFSSLISLYSCSGKVSEAEATLNDMLEAGLEPDIFVLTSLIQCYGKANQTDDVIRTCNRLWELGATPDDRFCACLLNVITQTPKEELGKLTGCIEKANSKLGYVVKLLVEGENLEGEIFKCEAHELFGSISVDVKKAYCNCLIDLSVNLNMLERACELLDLGLALEIYTDIQSKSPTLWSLHLKSLSFGAALTALHVWMNDLSKALEKGEELPSMLGINTGRGKHKYSSNKGLQGVLESHLKELNAPFHEAPDKVGWFLTTNIAAKSWLESRRLHDLVDA